MIAHKLSSNKNYDFLTTDKKSEVSAIALPVDASAISTKGNSLLPTLVDSDSSEDEAIFSILSSYPVPINPSNNLRNDELEKIPITKVTNRRCPDTKESEFITSLSGNSSFLNDQNLQTTFSTKAVESDGQKSTGKSTRRFESEEAKIKRKQRDAERHREAYRNETEEQRRIRRERDRERQKRYSLMKKRGGF